MESSVFVRLSNKDLIKLEIIDSAYEEDVSRKRVIKQGINIMLAKAIEIIYKEGEMTDEGLDYALDLLPDDFRDRVIDRINS